jgi:hypothetical protein
MTIDVESRKPRALRHFRVIVITLTILASTTCLLTVILLPNALRDAVTRYPGAVEERNCSDHPDPEYDLSVDSYGVNFSGVYHPCFLSNDSHQVIDAWYRQQGWEWYESWNANDPNGMGKQETVTRVGPLAVYVTKDVDTFDHNGQTEISLRIFFDINLGLPNNIPLP